MDSPERPHGPTRQRPLPATPGADGDLNPNVLAWRELRNEMTLIHARLEYIRLMLKLESRRR